VTFRWDGEVWALDVDDVIEIVAARPVTRWPAASRRLLGLVAWRGRTLPVVVPRALKNGLPGPDVKKRLLVLGRPAPFAVPLDEAGRVAVADPPAAGESENAPVRVDGSLVTLIDPEDLLANESSLVAPPAAGNGRVP
jgi:chemotaxis signal transduction protein